PPPGRRTRPSWRGGVRRPPEPVRPAVGGRDVRPTRPGSWQRPPSGGERWILPARMPRHGASVTPIGLGVGGCRCWPAATTPAARSVDLAAGNRSPRKEASLLLRHDESPLRHVLRSLHPHVPGHRSSAMRLADHEALARLAAHDHGILCTLHAERGIDAVPVVYVLDVDGYVGVPVD